VCKGYAISRLQRLAFQLYVKTAVLDVAWAEFFLLGDSANCANFTAMLQKKDAYQY
jgi:hypothetical protein